MATSPLFGWEEPDDTDLVKDGAAAIRTLGNAIDTSMGDLLGGTTGQVLSKASNTNMDFTWVTSDDANAIQNAIVDAKGDLISATAADTPARLAVGTNGQVLTADSTASTGIKWATPAVASSGLTLVKAQTIGTAVSSVTVTDAFSATYDNYLINLSGGVGSADVNIEMTIGNAAGSYCYNNIYMLYTGTGITGEASNGQVKWIRVGRASTNSLDAEIVVKNPFNTKVTTGQWRMSSATNGQLWSIGGGILENSNSYSSFTLTPNSGTLTGGTIRVYGYQNS